MAIKCPKCGGELAQTTPEIAKCKECGTAFKRKGTVNQSSGGTNAQGRKTKKCKYCKAELPAGARICPTCKRKQGGGCLKVLIVVIIFFFALGIAEAVMRGALIASILSRTASIDDETKAEKKGKDSNCNELTVGSSFEKNGLKITVNDASLSYQGYDNEFGLYDLPAGMKYIMVSFTFENNGDSDAYVSIYDFKCYADNTACEQAYLSDESDFMNTNLSSGRNISFQTYYSVPVDAQSIELEYETDFWTGEKAIVKLQ